jgi:hypothetical protein
MVFLITSEFDLSEQQTLQIRMTRWLTGCSAHLLDDDSKPLSSVKTVCRQSRQTTIPQKSATVSLVRTKSALTTVCPLRNAINVQAREEEEARVH